MHTTHAGPLLGCQPGPRSRGPCTAIPGMLIDLSSRSCSECNVTVHDHELRGVPIRVSVNVNVNVNNLLAISI